MGCMLSRRRELRKATITCTDEACNFNGIQKNGRQSYDSCELRPPMPAKTKAGKAPEIGSVLGRASIASIEKAVEVLDTLGSSMSNLNPSNGFISGVTFRGNKISILAFEVANTIAKGANILKSLSEDNIQLLKNDVLQSDGVRKLVSSDTSELLILAAADKRDELHVFSAEIIRFGDLCKDPVWHNLGRYFQKLDTDPVPQEQLKEDVEVTMQQLINLAQNTSELYHELHALDRFEQDYRLKLQEEVSLPAASREYLVILNSELKHQRKHVKGLKKRSLWSRSLEEVVEKLVDIVIFLHNKIVDAFGITGTTLVEERPVHNQRLGVSGLALHYANIINQIDNIVSQPLSIPPNTRDTLYHGLPASVKAALRSRLQSVNTKEEYTVPEIKAEMQKTLSWIVPVVEYTIRAHQGFGWVGEWANIGTEVNKKAGPQQTITRLQTLHYADKEKTEKYILELIVWLHHLVIQVRNRGYGFKALKPAQSQSEKGTLLAEETGHSQSRTGYIRCGNALQLSQDDIEMLESISSTRVAVRRSKSHGPVSRKEKRGHWRRGGSRSCGTSPSREFSATSEFCLKRTKLLDVIDGLDRLETLPSVPFCTELCI